MIEKPETIQQEEISLADIVKKIREVYVWLVSQLKILSITGALGIILGISIAYLKPTKYAATTTFSIDEDQASMGGIAGIASQFGFDVGSNSNMLNGENVIALYKSRRIIEKALLSKYPTEANLSYADKLIKSSELYKKNKIVYPFFKVNQKHSSYSKFQDSVMGNLVKLISNEMLIADKIEKKIDIYAVTVTSRDPVFSASFSKLLVNEVSNFYVSLKTEKSVQTINILQQKVDSIRYAMKGYINNRATILDANLNPIFQQSLTGVREKEIEMSASSQAYQELVKNLEVSKFMLLKQTPLLQIIDEPRYPLKKIKPSKILTGFGCGILFIVLSITFLFLKSIFKKFN